MSAPTVVQQVVDAFEGLTPLAKALGIPITTVSGWKRSGRIPAWRRPEIIAAAKRQAIDLPSELLNEAA